MPSPAAASVPDVGILVTNPWLVDHSYVYSGVPPVAVVEPVCSVNDSSSQIIGWDGVIVIPAAESASSGSVISTGTVALGQVVPVARTCTL